MPVGLRRKRVGGKAAGGAAVEEQGEPSQGNSLAKLRAHEESAYTSGSWEKENETYVTR